MTQSAILSHTDFELDGNLEELGRLVEHVDQFCRTVQGLYDFSFTFEMEPGGRAAGPAEDEGSVRNWESVYRRNFLSGTEFTLVQCYAFVAAYNTAPPANNKEIVKAVGLFASP